MSRSIFNEVHRNEALKRLATLTPQSERCWGKFSVNEMLAHCRMVNEAILQGESSSTPTIKEKSLKFLVLRIIKRLPKGIVSGTAYLTTENPEFEKEYYALLRSIEEFGNTENLISGNHPVFGKMNKKEWGQFVWMHLDHHLRQFGS